jgi:aspartyl-tRNA(Asn)/glutamyl-tRNA(Gln) amidotransferase subunit A
VPDFLSELDQADLDLAGIRIGVPESHFFEHLEPDIGRRAELAIAALTRAGASIEAVDLPHAKHAATVFFVLVVAEQAALQHDQLRDGSRPPLGEDVQAWAEFGNLILAKDYIRAQQVRGLIVADWARAFERVDAILTPATAAKAKQPLADPVQIAVTYPDGFSEDVLQAYGRFLMPVSLAGLPGLVVPAGLGDDGLPVGVQVVSPAFGESLAFRIGAVLERQLETAPARPPAVAGVGAS